MSMPMLPLICAEWLLPPLGPLLCARPSILCVRVVVRLYRAVVAPDLCVGACVRRVNATACLGKVGTTPTQFTSARATVFHAMPTLLCVGATTRLCGAAAVVCLCIGPIVLHAYATAYLCRVLLPPACMLGSPIFLPWPLLNCAELPPPPLRVLGLSCWGYRVLRQAVMLLSCHRHSTAIATSTATACLYGPTVLLSIMPCPQFYVLEPSFTCTSLLPRPPSTPPCNRPAWHSRHPMRDRLAWHSRHPMRGCPAHDHPTLVCDSPPTLPPIDGC